MARRTLLAEIYTRDEVDRLIRAASKRLPSGMRALFGLLYSSSLRIAEAMALKPADVDPVSAPAKLIQRLARASV